MVSERRTGFTFKEAVERASDSNWTIRGDLLRVLVKASEVIASAQDAGVVHGDLHVEDITLGLHGDIAVGGWVWAGMKTSALPPVTDVAAMARMAVSIWMRRASWQAKAGRDLVGARQMTLYGEENLPKKYRKSFAKFKKSELKTATVHAQKEVLRRLWDRDGVREARRHFKQWATWCRRSPIPRVIKVVDMIKSRRESVISFCRHPISTGPLEGMNSIIMAIRRAGRGYRHAETFGMATMFFCGKLKLMPDWK